MANVDNFITLSWATFARGGAVKHCSYLKLSVFHKYSLGGDTMARSELYTRLCQAILILKFIHLYHFLKELTYRSDRLPDWRGLMQESAFLASLILHPLRGSNSHKNPTFWGREQAFSSQTCQILKCSFNQNYCIVIIKFCTVIEDTKYSP